MSSSRESDESDLSEDESSSSEEFEPSKLIMAIIELHKANAEIILRFSLTSYENQMWVFDWLAENLHILSDSRNSWLLLSLENLLNAGDERAETVTREVASQFNSIGMSNPIKDEVLERVMVACLRGGYLSPALQSSVCTSAATLFANHQPLRLMLKHGFEVSDLSGKVKEEFSLALKYGRNEKSANFLAVFRVITEFKLKTLLEKVKDTIQSFKFVLHNNGGVLIPDIGHKVPTHAASAFNIVSEALKSDAVLIDKYYGYAEKICKELDVESDANKDQGWFAGWLPSTRGVRDSSTTACYKKILASLREGMHVLHDYQQMARESTSVNPTMPQ